MYKWEHPIKRQLAFRLLGLAEIIDGLTRIILGINPELAYKVVVLGTKKKWFIRRLNG